MNPLNVLLVEDNPSDVYIISEALKEVMTPTALNVARDGVEAMQVVRREEGHQDDPRPDLIFLDLNMPRKNGYEVLKELKEDDKLRRIPVIILTSSREQEDVVAAYHLYANGYLEKKVDLDEYIGMLEAVIDLWHGTMKLAPLE
ncbi:MAG: response regulator [Candidatus Poribacteria bacterium]|nr:response regulator [Candidatus Poribacteria bacterium]